MGQIWVREFTGGLDTRRMPETTPGGVLIQALDGHLTRGGEFEKRAAFVDTYTLPDGNVGLAKQRVGLVVFGSEPSPPDMPAGVSYQRLEHPDGDQELISVPSFDLFSGKIYAVGVFADGSRYHFYDGVRVTDWFDGRARASFRITEGGQNIAVAAQGSFNVSGGTLGGGNQITDVKVNGVTITSGAVAHTGDNATTADAVAANITAATTSPDYTAFAAGTQVVIVASVSGVAANGRVVAVTVGGDATIDTVQNMAGGSNSVTSFVTSVTIDGVVATSAPVIWSLSNSATAAAVAAEIGSAISSPEYSAISVDDTVVILADEAGANANGRVVSVAYGGGLQISPIAGIVMASGADLDETFEPGPFVKTIGSKMYSVSGPNLHGSGIQQPTKWTTDAVGAFFIDMSSYSSGSEELKAVANYQKNIAIFSESNIQIWFVDPDPSLNTQSQVLNNTGTVSARSVTQFGDSDLFYLNESGLRSLRARDSSNAAATTDIGVPVDTLITAVLRGLDAQSRDKIFGLIEPQEGRFWLIIKDQIFVFSFFSGAKVSAWSLYEPGFDVDEAVVFNKRVYLRSGNHIYVYGGVGNETIYDEVEAVAQLPYLDADDPTRTKNWQGFDAAAEGTWKVYAAMDPQNAAARDKLGVFTGSTFGEQRFGMTGASTHISLIFKSQGAGQAKLGSAVVTYESSAAEDSQ